MAKVLVFYYFPMEPGEDVRHPNVFEVPFSERLTLRGLTEKFPLREHGKFHWRFRTSLPDRKDYVWIDILEPDGEVPTYGGNIFAKILRTDRFRYSNVPLVRKQPGISNLAAKANFSSRHDSGASYAENDKTGNEVAKRPLRPRMSFDDMDIGKPKDTWKRDSKDEKDFFNASSHLKPFNPGVKPRNNSDKLPEYLEGKSSAERAKFRIELRRQEELRAQERKVEEKRKMEAQELNDQAARAVIAKELGPKLMKWYCPDGTAKNIRALLCTLHTILWEGANWTPVNVLVRPNDVKKAYRKALLVVHEDKIKNASVEVKYIAQTVFENLNKQYTIFAQTEMKNG